MEEKKLMTLQETIELHQKFGDDGFANWMKKSKESSDIESYTYIFHMQVRMGGMKLPKRMIQDLGNWLNTKTVANTTQEDYDRLTMLLELGLGMFKNGVEIPDDIGPVEFRIHNPARHARKKKKRNKNRM